MSEIRHDPITGEPVLFAPERADRPFAERSSECPFCPGQEHQTPPAIVAVGDPWRARVFPNKYPPIEGAEVIVESPEHGAAFHDIANPAEVVSLYVSRFREHRDAKSVVLFKNHGARAGASIAHLHSQLIPLPFTPPRIEREAAGFARARVCPLCSPRGEVIEETQHFVWLAPEASRFAYQQWIATKRHTSDFAQLGHIDELAHLLGQASKATARIADAYNWAFVDFRGTEGHAYVELFPRMTTIAGFELGSGTFVEIVNPKIAAAKLRR